MAVLFSSVGAYLTERIQLIRTLGVISCFGFAGVALIPYDRARQWHNFSLAGAFGTSTFAVFLANKEIKVWVCDVYVYYFVAYIAVLMSTMIVYRKDLKKANKIHAPLQKVYVLLMLITIVVFCLKLMQLGAVPTLAALPEPEPNY